MTPATWEMLTNKKREIKMSEEFDAKMAHKTSLDSCSKEQIKEKNDTLKRVIDATKEGKFSIVLRLHHNS